MLEMTSECRYRGKCDVTTRVFNFTGFIFGGKNRVQKPGTVIGARFPGPARQSPLCVLTIRTKKQMHETGIELLGLHVFSSKPMSIILCLVWIKKPTRCHFLYSLFLF